MVIIGRWSIALLETVLEGKTLMIVRPAGAGQRWFHSISVQIQLLTASVTDRVTTARYSRQCLTLELILIGGIHLRAEARSRRDRKHMWSGLEAFREQELVWQSGQHYSTSWKMFFSEGAVRKRHLGCNFLKLTLTSSLQQWCVSPEMPH